MTVLFLPISHSHSPPFLPFRSPCLFLAVEREIATEEGWKTRCARLLLGGSIETGRRDLFPTLRAPPRCSLLSSPSSVGRSTLQRGPYLRLLCRASTSPRSPSLASPRHSRLIKWKIEIAKYTAMEEYKIILPQI